MGAVRAEPAERAERATDVADLGATRRPIRSSAAGARPVARTAATLALAGGSVLAGCGGSADGSLAGKSAPQILSLALAAAGTERGVHYQLQATTPSEHETIVGDAGSTEGLQQLTNGANQVEVELVGGTAYLQGNAGGLQNTLGLPATTASAYTGRWISVAPTDSLFQPITQAVTVRGIFDQLSPTGTLHTSVPGKVQGQEVVAVIGGLPGSVAQGVSGQAVLYVSTSRPDLPVAFEGTASNSKEKVTDVGVFDRWDERLALSAPSGAVPYASLSGS